MRKVVFEEKEREDVFLKDISEYMAIFAKQNGKLVGMIINEDEGWILRKGDGSGCSGHFDSRLNCLESASKYKYSFYIETE